MLNQFAVEIPTLPVHLDYSPDILHLKGCWGLCSLRSDKLMGRQIFGIHPVYQETFLHIHRLLHQLRILRNWILLRKTIEEPIHLSTAEKSGSAEQDKDLRCQSGPSAKNSVIFSGGDSSKICGADQRLQISDLHFDKFPNPATFACWKIRFKTEVCICSQMSTEAMQWSKKWRWLIQWMNWDLRHLLVVFQCRILKYLMWGLLQRWTKSSIIPTSKGESVWRNKRPRKRTVSFEVDRLPTWSTNNSGSLEQIVLSKTTPTCSLLLFEMTIFRNSILSGTEYYCLWRKSRLMTSWKDCTN